MFLHPHTPQESDNGTTIFDTFITNDVSQKVFLTPFLEALTITYVDFTKKTEVIVSQNLFLMVNSW